MGYTMDILHFIQDIHCIERPIHSYNGYYDDQYEHNNDNRRQRRELYTHIDRHRFIKYETEEWLRR